MRTCFSLLFALFASLLLGGCMESSTVVHLNRDGSGTIVTTEIVNGVALDVIKNMGAQAGGPAEGLLKLTEVDPEDLKNAAGAFGEGVTLVSAKQIETKDGGKGREVTYKFTDITKLSFEQNSAGQFNKDEEAPSMSFTYTPGKLVLRTPLDPQSDPESMQQAEQLKQIPPQMKNLLKGMAVRIILEVEGGVKSTNALFPLPDKKGIVLADMKIGELIDNSEAITKFAQTKPSDRKAMQGLMKKYPMVRMENQETVTVEF